MSHELFNKGTNQPFEKYLNTDEVDCHCTQKECQITIYFDPTVEAFMETRDEFGEPIRVNSWFRCQSHNSSPAVGSNGNSMHVRGQACDLQPSGFECFQVLQSKLDELEKIMTKHFDFVKRYKTFIHGHMFNGLVDERKK